ncbi:transposase [Novosphingobium naphthalenivorans]|uniref:transposase n=1 Tax=Novosphingobium naphthalenivorans TaxID=273168 RepID=UPI00082C92E1|nr:transposase [Novosphingobium naphthalenivorans]
MDQQEVIADIERRSRNQGVPIHVLCARVGIHPSTFSRWKKTAKNPEPTGASLLTIGEIYDALRQIEHERSAKPRARKAVRA